MLNRNNDVCGAIRRIDLYSFIAWMYARSTVVGSKPGEHTVVSRLPRKRRCLQSIDVCPLLFLGQSTQIRFKRAIELRNYVNITLRVDIRIVPVRSLKVDIRAAT